MVPVVGMRVTVSVIVAAVDILHCITVRTIFSLSAVREFHFCVRWPLNRSAGRPTLRCPLLLVLILVLLLGLLCDAVHIHRILPPAPP
jgi:hypothetical protein